RAGLRVKRSRSLSLAFTEPRSTCNNSVTCRGLSQTLSTCDRSYRTNRTYISPSPPLGFKNGFAPPGALLAALWGDEPRRKAPASLVFGSGAYVHRITVGGRVVDLTPLKVPSVRN